MLKLVDSISLHILFFWFAFVTWFSWKEFRILPLELGSLSTTLLTAKI